MITNNVTKPSNVYGTSTRAVNLQHEAYNEGSDATSNMLRQPILVIKDNVTKPSNVYGMSTQAINLQHEA